MNIDQNSQIFNPKIMSEYNSKSFQATTELHFDIKVEKEDETDVLLKNKEKDDDEISVYSDNSDVSNSEEEQSLQYDAYFWPVNNPTGCRFKGEKNSLQKQLKT